MTGASQDRGKHHRWGGGLIDGVEGDRIDELLEMIWTLREKGISDLDTLLRSTPDEEAKAILRLMDRDGLFRIDGNTMVLKER